MKRAPSKKRMKKKVEQKPTIVRDVVRHKDGSITYQLPDDRRKFAATDKEVTFPPGKLPAFVCVDCGSVDPKVHAQACSVALAAHNAGVNFIAYCRDPSLWCVAVSGHGGEKIRCVGASGHDGLHGFPTSLSAIEAQRRLRGVEDAEQRATIVEKTHTPRAVRAARDERDSPSVSRPRGAGKEMMTKVIRILMKENPRKAGTKLHDFYAALSDGQTVAEYLEKSGAAMGNVLKCIAKGWIEVRDA